MMWIFSCCVDVRIRRYEDVRLVVAKLAWKAVWTHAFTHRSLYTNTYTHAFRHRSLYTLTFLHTDTFTHRSLYAQTLLHTEAFAPRSLYTQTLLHTDTLPHRRFYKQTLLHTNALHTNVFTQKLLHLSTHTRFFKHRSIYTHTRTCSDALSNCDVERNGLHKHQQPKNTVRWPCTINKYIYIYICVFVISPETMTV